MNTYKNIYKYIFVILWMVHSSVDGQAVQFARQLGNYTRNVPHQLHSLGQEIVTNKGKLLKAGLGWGAVSGAYYGGVKYAADFNPEVSSAYAVPQAILNKAGITTSDVTYITPSTFNAGNDPEKRWLSNGKGFWGNVISLISPSQPYLGNDGKLRVPIQTAKQLTEGKGEQEFLDRVVDQKDRHASSFDWKTAAECALDTAVWTPLFMLSPVVKVLRSATGAVAYMVPAIANRKIISTREAQRAVSKAVGR